MSAKTLKVLGPELAFSTGEPLAYQAIPGGTWTAEEKASLEWAIGLDGGAPQPLPMKGEHQLLTLQDHPVADSVVVYVRYAKERVSAHADLAVIRMSHKPYSALTASIGAANITGTELKPSKRILYAAKIGTTRFNIGTEQDYPKKAPTRKGLYLTGVPPGPQFRAGSFVQRFGHWSTLLEATTGVEGKQSFIAANTYDAASLTFGFIQFTPNWANANLVELLRIWLGRPDATLYFPELQLIKVGNKWRIHDLAGNLLEDDTHSDKLCAFLKPDPKIIGTTEKNYIARLVHLCRHDPQPCLDQVQLAVGNFRGHLKELHGGGIAFRPDYLCALICDIRNQGRATTAQVKSKLKKEGANIPNDQAYLALLKYDGAKTYADRVVKLDAKLKAMIADNRMGAKYYDEGTGEFVP